MSFVPHSSLDLGCQVGSTQSAAVHQVLADRARKRHCPRGTVTDPQGASPRTRDTETRVSARLSRLPAGTRGWSNGGGEEGKNRGEGLAYQGKEPRGRTLALEGAPARHPVWSREAR